MDQAEKYLKKCDVLQPEVIKALLDEFANEVGQLRGTIVDIGCGPGNSSALILPKLCSGTSLVGLDLSEDMVKCAQQVNAAEKRLTFEQLDIETSELPLKFIEKFNGGFSFFCLHWVTDLRQTFKNLFKLLKPGANLICHWILLFNGFNPYIRLAKTQTYQKYLKDAKKFITPLHFEKQPRTVVIEILQETGFDILHCSVREKLFGHASQRSRREFLDSVNPFVTRMPKELQNQFLDDLFEETLKEETVVFRKGEKATDEEKIYDLYKFLVIHVIKPISN